MKLEADTVAAKLLDDPEAAELFLGLGERAVGGDGLGAGVVDDRGHVGRVVVHCQVDKTQNPIAQLFAIQPCVVARNHS